MNSLCALSASKIEQHAAFSATSKRPMLNCPWDGGASRLMRALYALCCYFFMLLLHADCSFNYFLPYNMNCEL